MNKLFRFRDVLQEGGTAVDAALAALFCNGVYNCQSMGLGGGFLMTVYTAKVRDKGTVCTTARAWAWAGAFS